MVPAQRQRAAVVRRLTAALVCLGTLEFAFAAFAGKGHPGGKGRRRRHRGGASHRERPSRAHSDQFASRAHSDQFGNWVWEQDDEPGQVVGNRLDEFSPVPDVLEARQAKALEGDFDALREILVSVPVEEHGTGSHAPEDVGVASLLPLLNYRQYTRTVSLGYQAIARYRRSKVVPVVSAANENRREWLARIEEDFKRENEQRDRALLRLLERVAKDPIAFAKDRGQNGNFILVALLQPPSEEERRFSSVQPQIRQLKSRILSTLLQACGSLAAHPVGMRVVIHLFSKEQLDLSPLSPVFSLREAEKKRLFLLATGLWRPHVASLMADESGEERYEWETKETSLLNMLATSTAAEELGPGGAPRFGSAILQYQRTGLGDLQISKNGEAVSPPQTQESAYVHEKHLLDGVPTLTRFIKRRLAEHVSRGDAQSVAAWGWQLRGEAADQDHTRWMIMQEINSGFPFLVMSQHPEARYLYSISWLRKSASDAEAELIARQIRAILFRRVPAEGGGDQEKNSWNWILRAAGEWDYASTEVGGRAACGEGSPPEMMLPLVPSEDRRDATGSSTTRQAQESSFYQRNSLRAAYASEQEGPNVLRHSGCRPVVDVVSLLRTGIVQDVRKADLPARDSGAREKRAERGPKYGLGRDWQRVDTDIMRRMIGTLRILIERKTSLGDAFANYSGNWLLDLARELEIPLDAGMSTDGEGGAGGDYPLPPGPGYAWNEVAHQIPRDNWGNPEVGDADEVEDDMWSDAGSTCSSYASSEVDSRFSPQFFAGEPSGWKMGMSLSHRVFSEGAESTCSSYASSDAGGSTGSSLQFSAGGPAGRNSLLADLRAQAKLLGKKVGGRLKLLAELEESVKWYERNRIPGVETEAQMLLERQKQEKTGLLGAPQRDRDPPPFLSSQFIRKNDVQSSQTRNLAEASINHYLDRDADKKLRRAPVNCTRSESGVDVEDCAPAFDRAAPGTLTGYAPEIDEHLQKAVQPVQEVEAGSAGMTLPQDPDQPLFRVEETEAWQQWLREHPEKNAELAAAAWPRRMLGWREHQVAGEQPSLSLQHTSSARQLEVLPGHSIMTSRSSAPAAADERARKNAAILEKMKRPVPSSLQEEVVERTTPPAPVTASSSTPLSAEAKPFIPAASGADVSPDGFAAAAARQALLDTTKMMDIDNMSELLQKQSQYHAHAEMVNNYLLQQQMYAGGAADATHPNMMLASAPLAHPSTPGEVSEDETTPPTAAAAAAVVPNYTSTMMGGVYFTHDGRYYVVSPSTSSPSPWISHSDADPLSSVPPGDQKLQSPHLFHISSASTVAPAPFTLSSSPPPSAPATPSTAMQEGSHTTPQTAPPTEAQPPVEDAAPSSAMPASSAAVIPSPPEKQQMSGGLETRDESSRIIMSSSNKFQAVADDSDDEYDANNLVHDKHSASAGTLFLPGGAARPLPRERRIDFLGKVGIATPPHEDRKTVEAPGTNGGNEQQKQPGGPFQGTLFSSSSGEGSSSPPVFYSAERTESPNAPSPPTPGAGNEAGGENDTYLRGAGQMLEDEIMSTSSYQQDLDPTQSPEEDGGNGEDAPGPTDPRRGWETPEFWPSSSSTTYEPPNLTNIVQKLGESI